MEILNRGRLDTAKRAFATRRVPAGAVRGLLATGQPPAPGDLVLARVTGLGSHSRIELPSGRRAMLLPGDEIVLAYGNRYAPDQYEAYVPEDLAPCHMVAAGGIAARAVGWHDRLNGPTEIEPIGLLADRDGCVINVRDFALSSSFVAPIAAPTDVFAVFGTSMNAGKTTTAAGLVKGFAAAGYRVGAAKITGTGAGGDLWLMRDYGAAEALDFTDAGHATTFGVEHDEVLAATQCLLAALAKARCDVAILEIADGLFQAETAALAESEALTTELTGTFFAAGDAMGAVAGAEHLARLGHKVLGISGALTRSPLAQREASTATGVPVLPLEQLTDPGAVRAWASAQRSALAAAE
ncbi:hypothetical protein [Bauldia sp.]|uniref:hypothetical protein n=1 Tax=Bauldia sp. TaxID=2575872 RepID=UPI003BACC1CA